MAIIKGTVVSNPSGAMGGIVFSRNRGGAYMRTRSIPTNPSTEFQEAVRGAMVQLSPRWGDTLTPDQRTGWDVYALNVPIVNRVGDPINIGGIGHYIRSNVSRIQAAEPPIAIIDDAPTIFNLGSFTNPSIASVSEATQLLSLNFDTNDPWVNLDGAGMSVYISRPVSPSINFFKGPYRLAGTIVGSVATPESTPFDLTVPFAVVEDQKVFLQVRVMQDDGRISGTFRSADVVAA